MICVSVLMAKSSESSVQTDPRIERRLLLRQISAVVVFSLIAAIMLLGVFYFGFARPLTAGGLHDFDPDSGVLNWKGADRIVSLLLLLLLLLILLLKLIFKHIR